MAVYTNVSDKDIARFLESYGIGDPLALEPIAQGVENSNYLLSTAGGLYVLTLFERRTPEAELPYVIGLMRHLAAAGAPVPQPVPDLEGACLRRLNDRPALIVSYLKGRSLIDPGPDACFEAGHALGNLHRLAGGYHGRRKNPFGPKAWRDITDQCLDGAGDDTAEIAVLNDVERALAGIETGWPSDLPRGACHADLFPDNVFFENGRVSGIIDLYFACDEFLAYDLAVALVSWAFDRHNVYCPDRASAMMAGYGKSRTLLSAERAALPLLCLGAAVRFTLTRLYDRLHPRTDALVMEKDPVEFAARVALFEAMLASGGDMTCAI